MTSHAGGDQVTLEVSACFTPEDEAHLQRIWDLELRIRRLGIPTLVDLHDAWPESGSDNKRIAEKLYESSRRLGEAVGRHRLKVEREADGWTVHADPLVEIGVLTETRISLPIPVSHLTPAKVAEKLEGERSQLPKTGTNVICLDMSHVSDWYCVQLLHRGLLPFARHLDELSPGVREFFDSVDRDHRVAAVLLYTRDLHRLDLSGRSGYWRRGAECCATLAALLTAWQGGEEEPRS